MSRQRVLTRFPFINLAKAIERAKAVYENDRSGKGLKIPVAFSAWGYSDKSSGGFQTVAALKQYGILSDDGANEDRAVRLTNEARQFFQSEIEDDKAELRSRFAAKPALMAHLIEHWAAGTVDDPVARTYLKTGIGLNEQSARSALGVYKDNLPFIQAKGSGKAEADEPNGGGDGLGEGEKRKSAFSHEPPVNVKVGDRVQWVSQGADQFEIPRQVTEVVRDAERGWFVFVRGEKGAIPMEQIEVAEEAREKIEPRQSRNMEPNASSGQPIEVFLTAAGRLQISADVDRAGVDRLIDMLEKYKPILDLVGGKPN